MCLDACCNFYLPTRCARVRLDGLAPPHGRCCDIRRQIKELPLPSTSPPIHHSCPSFISALYHLRHVLYLTLSATWTAVMWHVKAVMARRNDWNPIQGTAQLFVSDYWVKPFPGTDLNPPSTEYMLNSFDYPDACSW